MKLLLIALFPVVFFLGTAVAAETPPQLNVAGFSQCLRADAPGIDTRFTERSYSFSDADFMLPYLAFYPGNWPSLLKPFRDTTLKRWSGNFEQEEQLLSENLAALQNTPQVSLTPGEFFQTALNACQSFQTNPTSPKDVFCAALIGQNVLRTLGRYEESGDLNPEWFKNNESAWLKIIPTLQSQMISLRDDDQGDRFGEWYHFFGILAFSAHELTLHGELESASVGARLNDLLHDLLTGAPEDPIKAQIDRDSVKISQFYLLGTQTANSPASCDTRAAYVLAQ